MTPNLLPLLSGRVHLHIVARDSVLGAPYHINIVPLGHHLLLAHSCRVIGFRLGRCFRLSVSLCFRRGEIVRLDLEQVVVS